MSFASVLLPEPEGPTMPTTWPAATRKLTSCSTSGAVDAVAEGDVLEGDVAADRRQRRARRIEVGSAGVLRMSPSRATDSRAWWKSCHICARRSTGALTRPAKMLKATSSPTVRLAVDDQLGAEIEDRRR